MTEHFELAQVSKSQLLGAEFSRDGQKIRNTRCEFDHSKFIKLSSESFLDLKGSQIQALKDVCFVAHKSEEFFLIINATNQWVRTVIRLNLHPQTWTVTDRNIHSNILPYDPYWSQLGDGLNTRVHFPSCMLEEAIKEEKTLKTKLQEWLDSGKKCEIGTLERKRQGISKWFWEHWYDIIALLCKHRKTRCFWEIQAADVQFEAWIAETAGISKVTWRGGTFVRKEADSEVVKREFEVVKRVNSHPNIIYGFGDLSEGTENSAYFMEYMSYDLCSFIIDRKRPFPSLPPFSSHAALGILLQFAKAMMHLHQKGVIHCDLKSMNLLISEIRISDNDSHYLVKVADFGSARCCGFRTRIAGFIPGQPTTNYAAPEVLKRRKDKNVNIIPHKIDVYSFGIVAFEVLTGENNHKLFNESRRSDFINGVIEGTLRPPLRSECQKNKEFIQDEELIKLIERCWDPVPSMRPSFEEICKDLNNVKDRISLEKISQSYPSPSQENSVNDPSSAPKVSSEGICDVDLQTLDSCRPHNRGWISASSCGVDHLFKSWKFIAVVFLCMFVFVCLLSLIKGRTVADLFKLSMALVLFCLIPISYLMEFSWRDFLFVTRHRIRTFRTVIFRGKVKIE